jgi:cytoskeletal protein RodZ
MKTIATIPVLILAFAACAKHQPAEDPSEHISHNQDTSSHANRADDPDRSVDTSTPADPLAYADDSEPAPRATSDSNAGTIVPDSAPGQLEVTAPDEKYGSPPVLRADNTGINERDRSGATKTPLDQSNAQADVRITQAIRKAVMAENSLSFTAKNVKIITEGGHVTLRGPVNSSDERAKIVAFAKQASGVLSVDDQLEVKP